jgi:hypothetical protein
VHRAGRGFVLELQDGIDDTAPDRRALAVDGGGEGVGARRAFRPGLVAVAA